MIRLAAVTLLLWPVLALSHGGGLDANGCHHDRKHGGYHCHRPPGLVVQPYSQPAPLSLAQPSSTPPGTFPAGVYRCIAADGTPNYTTRPWAGCVLVARQTTQPITFAQTTAPSAPTTVPTPPSASPRAIAGAVGTSVIPADIQGEWNAEPSACGADTSESRLRVRNDFVEFYESRGIVTRVDRLANNRTRVTLKMAGEGETWDATYTFQLVNGGKVLLDVSSDTPFARLKCPSVAPEQAN